MTSNVYVTMNDWNYAKEHEGELFAHWQAVGYTAQEVEVPSNQCDERFVIVHEEDGVSPVMDIVNVSNGSGAGKRHLRRDHDGRAGNHPLPV